MAGVFLDTEIVSNLPIPKDIGATGIVGEETNLYNPFRAIDRRSGKDLDNNDALIRILRNTDIDISLRTIGNAFFPRVLTVGTTPTLLIAPNRSPRGYILLNAGTSISGVVQTVELFPVGTVFPVGVTNSATINVSGHGGAAFFLNITEATAGPMTVDLQSLDPVSGNWVTVQADLFSGVVGIGTYYANAGIIGIDENARLRITVATDTFTGSLGAVLKPALSAAVASPTVFIGGPDVNTTVSYPLISGVKEAFWLKENTALYGIAAVAGSVNVFELQ